MKTQHTPAPWKIHKPDFETINVVTGSMFICEIPKSIEESEDTEQRNVIAEANARLIAAAPELLRACEWAVKQFEFLADSGKYPEHMMAHNGGKGYRILIDAIQKATQP